MLIVFLLNGRMLSARQSTPQSRAGKVDAGTADIGPRYDPSPKPGLPARDLGE
jgi:hypothetical protein